MYDFIYSYAIVTKKLVYGLLLNMFYALHFHEISTLCFVSVFYMYMHAILCIFFQIFEL